MISRKEIEKVLKSYDKKNLSLATLCSHSSLQIFYGARKEKVHTIGLVTNEAQKKLYDAFPKAKPDEFIEVEDAEDFPESELLSKNALIIPHGSIVEYTGDLLDGLKVPVLGNRLSLLWEKDRTKMFEWMKKAGLRTPLIFNPDKIDRPCVVKHLGAKGGRGYAIVHSSEEFHSKFENVKGVMVQEYLTGVRVYPHYFYSPLSKKGYRASGGHLEMMSIDRRFESNIDESYRTMMAGVPIKASFTVVGNEPLVLRESLLPEVLEMGKNTVEAADKLFGGIPGPFCLELIVDETLQFYAFEISARIVAGTNIYPEGSPYSVYSFDENMSTARRIAKEVKDAAKKDMLEKIAY
ncbi:5-formaminoimidazole-4-carboxamide-1-(beta)-D-ribofuranosyl 5'-monophosphate synthetase [Candidatus Micrarchaeota archaeon CG10_big_fil_rev_8_21_14_0_10_45_29]|nr:MAG: 5-formaminoimidazole-4-carboxamide-1-(beta)-D-ribofuranosyl 5'-monophosphate synthetase [Candidatus Micrarchaeota archaeon CG10_big_fil_rev_8_21_14_0_10_45_29]